MKKFNEFNRLNEGSDPEQTLLENLFSFFYKKYSKTSISEVESNFIKSALKLVNGGEISQEAYDEFIKSKGIDPDASVKITPKKTLRSFQDDEDLYRRGNNTNFGSCGNSGGYRTSAC